VQILDKESQFDLERSADESSSFSIHFLSISVSVRGSEVLQVRRRGWTPRRRFVADLLTPSQCHEGTQRFS
jgi:hypothetical protein